MKNGETIKSGLWNQYGEVQLHREFDKFYLVLDDWSGQKSKEVSPAFAQAFIEEFGEEPQ